MTTAQMGLAGMLENWTSVWWEMLDNLSALRVTWVKPITGLLEMSRCCLIFSSSTQSDNPAVTAGYWQTELATSHCLFLPFRGLSSLMHFPCVQSRAHGLSSALNPSLAFPHHGLAVTPPARDNLPSKATSHHTGCEGIPCEWLTDRDMSLSD